MTIWKLETKIWVMIFRELIITVKVRTSKACKITKYTIIKVSNLTNLQIYELTHLLWFVELVLIQNCPRRAPKWPRHSNSKLYFEILFDPCRDTKRNCSNDRSRFCSKNRRSFSSFRSIRCFVCCRTSPSHKWRFCRR